MLSRLSMAKKTTYRSRQLAALHGAASALHKVGALDKTTMREIDTLCLTGIEPLSGRKIQALRKREGISQAVLARCLNLTTGQISQLERGAKYARGATLKLLCLIERKGLEAVL